MTAPQDTIMNDVYLLLGGNIGDRFQCLQEATKAIEKTCGNIIQQSSLYETAAWGIEDQDPFLNQVLQLATTLEADDLLSRLLSIEETLGRKRDIKYGPRSIDIDILFYNNAIIELEGLKVPHPRMHLRRFVLEPLCELAPQKMHPLLHKTVARLLADCPDPLAVNKIS